MYLDGALLASWWQVWALLMKNIFVTEFAEFSENIWEKPN